MGHGGAKQAEAGRALSGVLGMLGWVGQQEGCMVHDRAARIAWCAGLMGSGEGFGWWGGVGLRVCCRT